MFECHHSEIKFRILLNQKNLLISPPLNTQSCIGQHFLADVVPKLQSPITQKCFSSTVTIFHCLFSFCFLFHKEGCQSEPDQLYQIYHLCLWNHIHDFFSCWFFVFFKLSAPHPLFSDLRRDGERKEKFGHSIRKCQLCETLCVLWLWRKLVSNAN